MCLLISLGALDLGSIIIRKLTFLCIWLRGNLNTLETQILKWNTYFTDAKPWAWICKIPPFIHSTLNADFPPENIRSKRLNLVHRIDIPSRPIRGTKRVSGSPTFDAADLFPSVFASRRRKTGSCAECPRVSMRFFVLGLMSRYSALSESH